MKKCAAVLFFVLSLAGLVAAVELPEPELVELCVKIFSWPAYEKLVFITLDGQVFVFGSGESDRVTVKFYDVVKTLARKGQDFGTVTNVVHNHKRGLDFSLPDLVLYEKLKKLGFAGKFQIFYPHSGKIKTLEKRGGGKMITVFYFHAAFSCENKDDEIRVLKEYADEGKYYYTRDDWPAGGCFITIFEKGRAIKK